MTREVPTLNLEQVSVLVTSQCPAYNYFHVFGLVKQECEQTGAAFWKLFDEFNDEISVKLVGPITGYPRPKPGDVVRIHRLKIDKEQRIPIVINPRNVVMWPAFQHEPKPITTARSPTITGEDIRRRRILETFFTSKIHQIEEIQVRPEVRFFNVAGRIQGLSHDSFGHLEINFDDGTGRSNLRVFTKKQLHEDNIHFETASKLAIGDCFVAINTKLDPRSKRFSLSANQSYGRAFRKVEKSSILGTILSERLPGDTIEPARENSNPNEGQVETSSQTGPTRRRSPRFLQKDSAQADNTIGVAENASPPTEPPIASQARVYANFQPYANRPAEVFPAYTKFSDLVSRENGYEFHDIVGQVRDDPRITSYGNYVMQVFDGSEHNLVNFHAFEVKQVIEGCLILYVYSKQKDFDTDEHIEMAKKLKDSDLIYVKNVRVSFKGGKVKLELSANKHHNKSINVIDKNSQFGRRLLDIVETPQVDELREYIDPSSSSQED